MKRWWIYQRERFPLAAHAPLIAAFSSSAVAYSALLLDEAPGWKAYLVSFVTCLTFFLQLRIADEFKDAEEDAKWRPYRAVPRGLVRLGELRVVFLICAALQLGLALWYHWPLVGLLLLTWLYLALMSVEFFARDWLKSRPVTYLWSHMLIMPLVDLYATSTHWMPLGEKPLAGLMMFIGASFFNGIVLEMGRKIRCQADEEEGVETYSILWGRVRAGWVWWALMLVTYCFAVAAGWRIGFAIPVAASLGAVLLIARGLVMRATRVEVKGGVYEAISGLWTLVMYLMLGLIPLLVR